MDVYALITDRIIAELDKGTVPWRKTWTSSGGELPANLTTGKPYRGINTFLLAMAPYASHQWCTFKQAQATGGSVRKGEKGYPVVFWKWLDDKADPGQRPVPLLRYYTVFNVEQCDGLDVPGEHGRPRPTHERIKACEELVAAMPQLPQIAAGSAPCYSPALDRVSMPGLDAFDCPEEYYGTLFHELGHATGHASRLDRSGVTDGARFASHAYSKEELIAEMTAAFLAADTGIEPVTLTNHAAYIRHWLAVLRGDSRMVITAAAAAQKAADFVLGGAVQVASEAA